MVYRTICLGYVIEPETQRNPGAPNISSAPPNKALHLTLCCSLGVLPQDRRSHESAAESGR